jgi:hypothetical protein
MGNLLAFIAAIAASIAAFASWRTAEETKKLVLAQIINDIRDQFATKQLEECIKELANYRNLHENFEDQFYAGLALSRYAGSEEPELEIDNCRRMYSHIFHKLIILLNTNCIDKEFIKKIIYADEVDILLNIVEPLEKAKAKFLEKEDYNHTIFDIVRKIFQ